MTESQEVLAGSLAKVTEVRLAALALFLALGGAAWFDALPLGPARYEAIDRMVDILMWRTGCSEREARKAVGKAIGEGRKGKTND